MMRTSRVSHEYAVIHQRSAVLFMDVLDTFDRFAVASVPRPAVRGMKAEKRDRVRSDRPRYLNYRTGQLNQDDKRKWS